MGTFVHEDQNFSHAFYEYLHGIYGSFEFGASSYMSKAPHPVHRPKQNRQRHGQATATFDSGSNIHLWSLKDARNFFRDIRASNLRVQGISKIPALADSEGHLVVSVEDSHGNKFNINMGKAYALDDMTVNLLSVSLLIRKGSIIHFEAGDCYFQTHAGSPKIPLVQNNGLFQLPLHHCFNVVTDNSNAPTAPMHSFAVDGTCYGAHADARLWHARLRHMPMDKLALIHELGLVDGLSVHGKIPKSCRCDVCMQSKIRRSATPRKSPAADIPWCVGHTVSTDVKSVPYTSMNGYKYVICFVDHYSRLSFCYFMRLKNESAKVIKDFLREMHRLGVKVRTVQSDRGSEYFSQEGDTQQDRDRRQAEFTKVCDTFTPKVHHVVTAVEQKEKLAEVFFRDHFEAADSMLWNARLSPVFWADAISYSVYIHNRTPIRRGSGPSTPLEIVTGDKARWDKLKVFGCTVYQHIPNNTLAKIPGVPKGKRLLFMGFNHLAAGWRVFCPETRRYFSTNNAYFFEDMRHRIDSLRHHDLRRQMIKRGEEQPFVLDDFHHDDLAKGDSIRQLYLSPDAPIHSGKQDRSLIFGESQPLAKAAAEPADGSVPPMVGLEGATTHIPQRGPLSEENERAERARSILRSGAILRPFRTSAIGVPLKMTPDDRLFLNHVRVVNAPLRFHSPCPKTQFSSSRTRYLKYMHATTYLEARELGAQQADIEWDYLRGWISFPKHEPDLPGHVFDAFALAARHGHTHILDDIGRFVKKDDETDFMLAEAFSALKSKTRAQDKFNDLLRNAYEPDGILAMFEQRQAALRYADYQMAKVMNASSVKIDFSIAPEPTRYEQTLPEVCPDEFMKWRAAMDDEMTSMSRFGVYKRVPKSAAKGRQILGARWVYKRKINEYGQIYRHRARLVAQGFLQKPYDSFHPDETFSPVVHKDTLRLFLSLSAAEDLQVYQADVKAAFLQAPLKEKIYVRAPPGYSSVDPTTGEDQILELSKAIYGLKQSSACFWTVVNDHLVSQGFKSMLGDPCLFKKTLPSGKIIMCVTYIDDITYSATDKATADEFLADLKKRFVIEDGEGAPVSWLLNMKIHQDLLAGTISMNQEVAITKLAESLLSKEELVKASGIHYPMHAQPLKKLSERIVPKEDFDYLSVVGSLLHLANCVRCDVAVSVGILARHALYPGHEHVRACKRVVQYLYNTRTMGITYRRPDVKENANRPLMYEGAKHPLDDGKNLLQTFADSDYAADDTKRSTMGIVTMMNGGPISWASILGKTVSTSTCEAEVNAAVVATKDALHIAQLLRDLGYITNDKPLQIAEDNAACIAQAKSGIRHVRNAKHYQVKLRFLQQHVVDRTVEFIYCPTDYQLSDAMTKPLIDAKFRYFRNVLFGLPLST